MKSIALILLFLVLPALPVDRLEKARERLQEARKNLDDAERALIRTYVHLEGEYDKISGPNCADFLKSLADTWIALRPEINGAWEEISTPGKRASEKRFDDAVGKLLSDSGADAARTDARLVLPFRRTATALIFDSLRRGNSFDDGQLLSAFREILTSHTPFHELWNKRLLSDIAEAGAFARANEKFAETKDELDRLLRPTEFDERGRRVPPGKVAVPGGIYFVGPNTGWELKRRKVKLAAFLIDKYEVTNKEFNIFLRTLDEETRLEYMPYFWPKNVQHEQYYPEDRADHPVVGVSWEAANAYAQRKGERLPTEEEWEAAAGGKDGRLYPWGSRFDLNACNSHDSGFGSTIEVGGYPRGVSPFGCHDMAGNAAEWTGTDQDGKTVKAGEGTIVNVVIRGGSYRDDAARISCRYRWLTPMSPYEGSRPTKKVLGFRCVRDAR
jgi:formylglycine-generating enzyme required for sulfatase activity